MAGVEGELGDAQILVVEQAISGCARVRVWGAVNRRLDDVPVDCEQSGA
jgi:hypothetical protein